MLRTTRGPASAPHVARTGGIVTAGLVLLAGLSVVHLTQGTSDLGAGEVLRAALNPGADGDDPRAGAVAVLLSGRVPRLLAALLVGAALGLAGTALQSVARNPLASPDTLAVNAGAYVTVVAVAAFGLSLPFYLDGLVAFAGGLAAAGLVLLVARGGAQGPARLILAGSAVALALDCLASVLLMLFQQNTTGLFAWATGSTVQSGPDQVRLAAPLVLAGAAGLMLLASRLDVLGLGDDEARVVGLRVARTRVLAVVLAVLLAATAATVTGPIGFVGLAAPVIARLLARRVPGLGGHLRLLPFAALVGALIVVTADVLLRLALPADVAVGIPTDIVTTLAGAVLMVRLALSGFGTGGTEQSAPARVGTRGQSAAVAVALTGSLVVALVAGLLLGDRLVLLGDLSNWLRGEAGPQVSFVMTQRWPRVLGALLGGAALALAGSLVQAVCRNPLAEPGLLGVTPGAGIGALLAVLLVPGIGIWPVMGCATAAALATFALVYRVASAGGGPPPPDRLVLVGVGVAAACTAVISLTVLILSPWNTNLALTWLAGSTYGRTPGQLLPAALVLVAGLPVALVAARTLDLVSVDDDVPRILGVSMGRVRPALLGLAAVLTAAATSAIGALTFVGLVAPHAARMLVGAKHKHSLPVAVGLGALMVSVADTFGRTVIAPGQLAAGLATAMIGAPYFVVLLSRTRSTGAA